MKISCGHCRETHESVQAVRDCAKVIPGTLAPKWLTEARKANQWNQQVGYVGPSHPSNVQIDADGNVSWTNPKHNPWKDMHHEAEQDYTGGEYTRQHARTAVDREFQGTNAYGYLCPNAKCEGGYCHFRATVNAAICVKCGTAMHGGSHEVYKPGQDFEPTQWYLLQTARWVLKHASKVENYNADWDIVAECKTEAEVVDELREKGILKFDAAIAHFQAYVELVGEQRRSVQNEVF